MQLIQQSEPAPIDIKKTMSSLGEEGVEDNQINGVISNIVNDVCIKISTIKNDKAPHDENGEHNEDKDCNGITNGDSQIEHKVSALDKEPKIIENSENGSSANGESNGDLSNESKSPTSATASFSKIDENVDLDDKLVSESIKQNEENIVTSDKNSSDVIDDKNSSDNVDKQASVCNEEVPVDVSGQILKNDELSMEDVTAPTTEDKSYNETENNILTNDTELIIPKLEEIQSSVTESTEKVDDVTISEPVTNNTVDVQMVDSSTVSIEETPIEAIEKGLDNSLKGTSSVKETTEDNLTLDVTENPDSTDKTYEMKESLTDSIEKMSEENNKEISCSKIDMELDKIKPEIIETEEKSDKEKSVVEPSIATQKFISVKNITEMTNSISPADEITKNHDTKISNEQESEIHEIDQNASMDVDDADVSIVLPENGNSDTTDKISIVDNDVKMTDTTETKKIEVSEKDNEIDITEKERDGVVMEIDDTDEVTFVDKPPAVIKTADVNNSENDLKQDSVINIIDNDDDEKKNESDSNEIQKDDASEVISIEDNVKDKNPQESKISSEIGEKIIKVVERKSEEKEVEKHSKTPEKAVTKQLPVVCKLSNTMDILSDEEDETTIEKPIEENKTVSEELKAEDQNKCINIDDDDDIMFIEDTNSPNFKNEDIQLEQESTKEETQTKEKSENKTDLNESEVKKISPTEKIEEISLKISKEDDSVLNESSNKVQSEETKPVEPINEIKPIITQGFLKSVTKNLADMTRNELEDFCILKLVESVVDKSNLNEIKNKMKTMAQTVEDLRKKAVGLAKQNRDLQVVVKTVQEDQKKRSLNPMMPMKITRSVGMQVVLTLDKTVPKKNKIATHPVGANKQVRNLTKTQKPPANIPVPRLVPASSPTVKSPVTANATKTTKKTTPQRPEKRPHSELSRASSETVDLTDDEPPAKVNTKPIPPVRLVPSQNLMPTKTRPPLYQTNSSPRKVYIPISSTNQNRPPGTGVIRNFVPTPRPRQPSVVRMQAVRLQTPTSNRHPAPLPDAMKQYQPPAWKALPPAPDLKLSKVDNGIVISWKFEGYQPDSYEEVASFQLYAYQETPAPPSTALWKKIGDIKALPLPMACTLTQFMSGFKYYFAVRAIDVRSRIGPFSLPGSIMLISKT